MSNRLPNRYFPKIDVGCPGSIVSSFNSSFSFLTEKINSFRSSVASDQIVDLGEHGLLDDSSSYFDLNLGRNGIRMGT